MKLYEIDRKIDELLEKGFTEDCVDMETGEILVDKAVSLLDALKMEQEKKLEGIACYIKNLAADSKKIREEEKNLAERRKSLENRQKRLSDFLSAYLQDRAIYRFDSARCKISFRKSEAVEIYDSSLSTGHDVLDMILAEQGLYCREQGIKIHCVADGAQMQFMEDSDLYALCTGILQQSISQIQGLPNSGQRELDLQVYRRQGIVVLEAAAALPDGTKQRETILPEGIADILHKYGGELFSSAEYGCAVMRCLFPAPASTSKNIS